MWRHSPPSRKGYVNLPDKKAGRVIIAVMVIGFLWGLFHLMAVRFGRGDIYPAYSSLRSDPLGTQALFESLAGLDNVRVIRHFDGLSRMMKIEGASRAAVLFAGVEMPDGKTAVEKWMDDLDQLTAAGARVVIALKIPGRSFADAADQAFLQRFEPNDDSWQVLRAADGHPAVIEKAWSKGSIVLSADSYVFSNEALQKQKNAAFLARVFQRNVIIFDEYHLGIRHQDGISTLIRKYRLSGAAVVTAVFFLLFVWKNITSLIPPDEDDEIRELERTGAVKDHLNGLTALLRHHVPPSQIVARCADLFEESLPPAHRRTRQADRLLEEIRQLAAPSRLKNLKIDPRTAYQDICRIISEGKMNEY